MQCPNCGQARCHCRPSEKAAAMADMLIKAGVGVGSTVNRSFDAPTVHALSSNGGEAGAMCGKPVLSATHQLTAETVRITCVDCAIRMLALVHSQQAVLLKLVAVHVAKTLS